MPEVVSTAETVDRPRASLVRAAATGCVLGALLACVAEVGRMVADRNQHVVLPGRVYRSAQLSPSTLETVVRRDGIRTVVNLRGRPFGDWFPAEAQATQALGVSQENVTLSASRLPAPGEVRHLIGIFDQSEHPVLLHCQQGADRTGLAAAMYLLLYTDADYRLALRQCSPRYGHLPLYTTAAMDEFFQQYEHWLADQGVDHTPARFRRWATAEYSPGPARGRMELIDPPAVVDATRPVVFKLRAYNNSREVWRMTAGSRSGIHARFVVFSLASGDSVVVDAAGFQDATVPPGGFIDLNLPVPAPARPGRYMLLVELCLRNASFTQYGSEPLNYDWEARDPAPVRDR